jgi:hypothetical protein
MTKKLLEQYIENVIKETLAEQKDLQNEDLKAAFVDPLADIFNTAIHGIKDMGVRVKSTIKTLVKGLPTLFVPFLDADYAGIAKEEEEELNKLKEKYQEVFNRNDAALYGTDLAPMLFLLDPQKFLGAKLAQATPAVGLASLRTLQIMTGGTSETINKFAERWSHFFGLDQPASAHGPYHSSSPGVHNDTWGGYGVPGGGWGYGNVDYGSGGDYGDPGMGGFLEEAPDQQQAMEQFKKEFMSLINNPELMTAIAKSQMGQQMGNDIMGVFVKHVAKFMAAKSYDELVRNNSQELSKVNAQVQSSIKQAKPEEIQKVKDIAFLDVKKLYKEYYVNKIKNSFDSAPSSC